MLWSPQWAFPAAAHAGEAAAVVPQSLSETNR